MIRSLIALVMAALLAAGCGGGDSEDRLEGDLAATTEVIQVPVEVVDPVARDRYGFVTSTENRIDAFVIPVSDVERYGTYTEPPPADSVRFVRDPIARGALAPVLDPATEMVIMLIPLLDPTQELQIGFDARFIGLDADGSVVSSDYDDEIEDRLDELFEQARAEGISEAAALADMVEG